MVTVSLDTQLGRIYVLTGHGDGTFSEPAYWNAFHSPGYILAADFSEDGHEDLAVSNREDDIVSIYLGTGYGTFPDQTLFDGGRNPQGPAVCDLNEDGHLDLFVGNTQADYSGSILHGNGAGSFERMPVIYIIR